MTRAIRTIPTGTIDRFARDWRALTGEAYAAPVLVALSGGPDSSALLLLFAALGAGEVRAATVDHGIRPAASDEARLAGELAVGCGVPHATLRRPLPPRVDRTANLSARARALRYALLEQQADAVGARWIATAHHADDQLETLVMRLGRGAGLRGLAGVRPQQGRVVRPLLGWRRAELAALILDCGVTAASDPSNVDDRFDRARMRKALAGVDWLDPLAASRSAAALADAEEAIGWSVDRLAAERCRLADAAADLRAGDLPREFARRLVERCLRHVDHGIGLRGEEVGRVVDRLAGGDPGTLGAVRYAVGAAGWWAFRPAPPRRPG